MSRPRVIYSAIPAMPNIANSTLRHRDESRSEFTVTTTSSGNRTCLNRPYVR